MTPQQRTAVRTVRDRAARARTAAEVRDSGAPDCAFCGADIDPRKPGKRYCTDLCRKRGCLRDRRTLKFRGVAA